MPKAVSMDGIGPWLKTLWSWVEQVALGLVDLALALAHATTSDHLEGAAVMALLLLGPSLLLGLFNGFWEGLRIEWGRYQGQARVIDGDTLEIRGERLRLFAIDAPELGQPWWDDDGREQDAGASSREALAALIEGRRLSVKVLREDQYRRSVAIIKVDGRDIARSMVGEGWAFAAPGSARYRRTEKAARRRKRGLWQGELERPWEYRAA